MARKHSFRIIMILWICALLLSPAHTLQGMDSKTAPHRSSSEMFERTTYYFKKQTASMNVRECFDAIAANDQQKVSKMIIDFSPEKIYPGTNKTLFQAHAELIDTLRKKSSSYLNNDFTQADAILSLLLKNAAKDLEKQ